MYACASRVNGDCCTNPLPGRRTLAEGRILAAVKRDLRDPAVLTEVEQCMSLSRLRVAMSRRFNGPSRKPDRGPRRRRRIGALWACPK